MSDLSHAHLSGEEPWPGLAWFEEVDQPFFRGRAAETAELIRLVRREALTVLFGRSGLGKTSLLKAGLFPALRAEDFLPVYIRLDHAAEAPSLRQQVWQALWAAVEREGVQGSRPLPEEELWNFLHRRDAEFWSGLNRPVIPVIVFDQFEEIFTLGQQEESLRQRSELFLDELADLVENRPPAAVKQQLEQEPEAAGRYEFRRATAKLVLSFREDFLAEIERLKTVMPSLMVNRLRLLPMNGTQAYAVVTEAGGRLVDDEVARRLLQLTWKNAPDPPADPAEFPLMEIDPALLSVVCRELNTKRRDVEPPLERITAELMAGADREILKGFYERGMEGLDPRVRSFVEEELITQQGYRDSHDWEDALVLPGVTPEELELLIARRLLRSEERQGRRRLELTHDVLAKVVRDSRDNRRAREAEAAEAKLALDLAERGRAAETARSLQTTRMLLRLSGVLGAGLFLFVGVALWQSIRARGLALKVAEQAQNSQMKAMDDASKLRIANKDITKKQLQAESEKLKAENLANQLKQALSLAAEREQQAIVSRKQAEQEKVEADIQRSLAQQQRVQAEEAERKAKEALKEAGLQRRRANEEAAKAEEARLKLEAFQFLSRFEQLVLKAQRDPIGGIVIGLGHTLDEREKSTGELIIEGRPVRWQNGITREQAYKLFSKDIQRYLEGIDRIFKVKLNRNQRLALLSFVFNLGIGGPGDAYPTLLKKVNQGRFDEVPEAFMIYVNPGSSVEAVLRRRRQAEADLWKKPP